MNRNGGAPSVRMFELRMTSDLMMHKKSKSLQDSDQFPCLHYW